MEKLKLDTEPDEPDEPDEFSEDVLDGNDSNGTTSNLSILSSLNESINSYNTVIDELCKFIDPLQFGYDNNTVKIKINIIKKSYEEPLKIQIEQIISSKSKAILDVRTILENFRNVLTQKLNKISTPIPNFTDCPKAKKQLLSDIISYIGKQISKCDSLLYIVSIGEYKSNDDGFNVSVYENLNDPSELSETITATASSVIETDNPTPKYQFFITVGTMDSITEGAMAFGNKKDELIQNAKNIFDSNIPNNLDIRHFPYKEIENMGLENDSDDDNENKLSTQLVPLKNANQK